MAAILKLEVYVEAYHPTATTDPVALWYRGLIWALAEHGLSLFASSILALRPLSRYVSRGWSSLGNTLHGSGSGKSGDSSDLGVQSWLSKATEMNAIGVRNDVSVYSEDNASESLTHPLYVAEVYNESHESHRKLLGGKRAGRFVAKEEFDEFGGCMRA